MRTILRVRLSIHAGRSAPKRFRQGNPRGSRDPAQAGSAWIGGLTRDAHWCHEPWRGIGPGREAKRRECAISVRTFRLHYGPHAGQRVLEAIRSAPSKWYYGGRYKREYGRLPTTHDQTLTKGHHRFRDWCNSARLEDRDTFPLPWRRRSHLPRCLGVHNEWRENPHDCRNFRPEKTPFHATRDGHPDHSPPR